VADAGHPLTAGGPAPSDTRYRRGGAGFLGVVVSDSAKLPIPNVGITIPELSFSVLTNEKGEFRLHDIPAGPHRILARRLGYGPADATIDFAAFQTIERQIVLGRTVVLGEVKVMATDRRLRDFEDHRKIGLGKFLDRAQLKEREGQTFQAVLSEIPSLQMVRGYGNYTWLATKRRTKGSMVKPSFEDINYHYANSACYSDIFVDGIRVYFGRDGEDLFNFNNYHPSQIEALEYYANRHETPSRYDTGRDCGALVLTLRR